MWRDNRQEIPITPWKTTAGKLLAYVEFAAEPTAPPIDTSDCHYASMAWPARGSAAVVHRNIITGINKRARWARKSWPKWPAVVTPLRTSTTNFVSIDVG